MQGRPRHAARAVAIGFFAALALGITLTVAFTQGQAWLSSALFQTMFVLALFLPPYRAECVLGFMLGTAVTFGAVLPIAIPAVVAVFAAIMHSGVYPTPAWAWRSVLPPRSR